MFIFIKRRVCGQRVYRAEWLCYVGSVFLKLAKKQKKEKFASQNIKKQTTGQPKSNLRCPPFIKRDSLAHAEDLTDAANS